MSDFTLTETKALCKFQLVQYPLVELLVMEIIAIFWLYRYNALADAIFNTRFVSKSKYPSLHGLVVALIPGICPQRRAFQDPGRMFFAVMMVQ
jgi:hypothetical protein